MGIFESVTAVLSVTDGHDAAIKFIRTFDDSVWRDEARYGLINYLVSSGALDQAEAEAQSMENRTLQAWALGDLVRALLAQGEIEHAAAVARNMRDSIVRGATLGTVTQRATEAGDLMCAAEIARAIDHLPAKVEALTRVATALGQTAPDDARSMLREAEGFANSTPEIWRSAPLGEVAKAWIMIGDTNSALDIISSCDFAVVPELISAGGRRVAEAVADLIDRKTDTDRFTIDDRRLEWNLSRIADALAEHGLRDRAEKIVSRVSKDDTWGADWALSWLAVSAARRGDFKRAAQFAQRADATVQRASILAAISAAVIRPDQSRRFLADAIATDLWEPLPVLVQRDTAARSWIADEYLALWNVEDNTGYAVSTVQRSW